MTGGDKFGLAFSVLLLGLLIPLLEVLLRWHLQEHAAKAGCRVFSWSMYTG